MIFAGAKKSTAVDSLQMGNNGPLIASPSTIKKEKRELISPLLMYNMSPTGKMEFDEFAMYAIERFTSK